jgi:hypothetical protein
VSCLESTVAILGEKVKEKSLCRLWSAVLFCIFFLMAGVSAAQEDRVEQGRSIGKVSVKDNLIVMELDEGVLGRANLFDLDNHTLRFAPDGVRYRIESGPLQWDSDFGPEISGAEVTLHQFQFPFSGKQWNSFRVGRTGSIRFGTAENDNPDAYGHNDGGVTIGRFDPLGEAAGSIVESAPAICVFFKPRTSGPRYVKELPDRVVVTWDLTEPWGNIQDFTWRKTVNRFQAVLHRDGSIELSYKELAAKDGIVGVYPLLAGAEKSLATIAAQPHPSASANIAANVAANLDVRSIKLSVVDDTVLKISLETRGPVVAEGDKALDGIMYRVTFDTHRAQAPTADAAGNLSWTIRGITWGPRPPRYVAFGPGVTRRVKVEGNTISMHGLLPPALRGVDQVTVAAEIAASGNPEPVARIEPHSIRMAGIRNPEVHFSSLTRKDGPFAIAYESFHYLHLPRSQDLSCTILKSLGDNFDFLAYYSDFRIDNQEAGTPSDGPKGGNVLGTGELQHDLASYCTQGRFQWEFVQPVYVGSNQMQKYPPDDAPVGGDRDVTFYLHQLGERSPDGKLLPYNYAMSQIGHEMGHRWSAFVSAKVNGETFTLGPTHWARGLQAPVAFPYQRPTEASAMGGGVWQDNFDGTFTQLDDDYYVPATGFSYLDLYLMGLISPAEVPDFFLLKNLVAAGKDANGHPMFKADRTKVTIQDVIAVEGPRLPDVDHSQRKFNTGIVVVVEHGKGPSPELIERANGIRERWMDYWETVTGHRTSMTTNPR